MIICTLFSILSWLTSDFIFQFWMLMRLNVYLAHVWTLWKEISRIMKINWWKSLVLSKTWQTSDEWLSLNRSLWSCCTSIHLYFICSIVLFSYPTDVCGKSLLLFFLNLLLVNEHIKKKWRFNTIYYIQI